jgi:hypothetical protein
MRLRDRLDEEGNGGDSQAYLTLVLNKNISKNVTYAGRGVKPGAWAKLRRKNA